MRNEPHTIGSLENEQTMYRTTTIAAALATLAMAATARRPAGRSAPSCRSHAGVMRRGPVALERRLSSA